MGDDDEMGGGGGEPVAIDLTFLSDQTYAGVAPKLSAPTNRAMAEAFRFTHLSKVQAATLDTLLAGGDVFARAKTGSGKTLGFLIPTVERLRAEGPAPGIRSLVIAPTRELALQIMAEAQKLLTFDSTLTCHSVIGGRNISTERSRMGFGGRSSVRVDLLIGTPGRLVDHIDRYAVQRPGEGGGGGGGRIHGNRLCGVAPTLRRTVTTCGAPAGAVCRNAQSPPPLPMHAAPPVLRRRWRACACWCWTRRIACWTWAFGPRWTASWRHCPAMAARRVAVRAAAGITQRAPLSLRHQLGQRPHAQHPPPRRLAVVVHPPLLPLPPRTPFALPWRRRSAPRLQRLAQAAVWVVVLLLQRLPPQWWLPRLLRRL